MNTDEHKSLCSVHPSGVLTGVDQGSTSGKEGHMNHS